MSAAKDRAKIETLAEKFVKKEKYAEAIAEYQKLLSGDEQDVQIWNIIGDLYLKSKKKVKAVDEFKKIADYYEGKGIFTKSIAIYKRISRLVPEDLRILRKLADLYWERGFISEAKSEYSQLAQKYKKTKAPKDAIETYKILLKLDSDDVASRLNLAELFIQGKQIDQAVEELNEAAELKIRMNALKEADEILKKARSLNKEHSRTLENMIDLFKLEKRKKEALKLVNEILKKDKENLKALYLLGNLCFEGKELKKAEEIFGKILSIQSNEVEARVKLGRVYLENEKLDETLELYRPLVDTLIKKQKEDKAIGLIGLILMVQKTHVPSLELLAGIYKEKKQKKSYEIVARRLMKEYQKKKLKDKMAALQEELPGLVPEEIEGEPVPSEAPSVKAEPEKKKTAEALPDEEPEPEPAVPDVPEEVPEEVSEDYIASSLEKTDQFMHQGLFATAKSILDDLQAKFPDDKQISKKRKELASLESRVEEEAPPPVEKMDEKETELFGGGEKLTAAEIFADTDIVPHVSQETGEKRYFDLSERLEEELEAIKNIIHQQTRGDTTVVEKELSTIVSDFKKKVDEKIGRVDLEARYNLGIAYLEQGLLEDAIKEFELACQDKKWELESYTNLGECHKRMNEFDEAIKWYEKALPLVGEESVQAYALKYEIASLYEAKNESRKALLLFGEVLEWNPDYGDVTSRIKSIEEQASK